ncbi:MAG: fibronectin type III domain-containing protein, partial [Syntrophomonas sp.]
MRIKIKHLIRGLMFLMFVGFLLLDSQTLLAANASDSVLTGHTGWTFVDGNGIGGLNKDTAQTALNPSLVGFDNALYAAWHETNGAANQIRVKKYDGASWTSVDGDGADGLNKDPAMNAQNPNLAVYNNELYAIWNEQSSSLKYQIRVKKYDGSSWASVDGDGDNGLNKNTAKNGGYPTLVVYNNALYAAWHESHGAVFQIRVKKYDGVSWTFVDGNNDDGLNKVPTKVGKNPSLAIWNNALYTAWYEIGASIGQIRVKKYEGTNWTFVDGDGADGLNRDPAMNAQNPSLAMYNNELYAAWYESNGSANQIRVKKYDGSSWSFIDGNGLAGLNKDFAKDARNPSLAVLDDALYVSWYESNESVSHIRVKKYDGSSWAFVDGNGTIGLNKDVGMETRNPRLTVFNDALYTIWFEFNGTADQIRVAKYNPAIPVTNASAPNIDVQPQDQTINAGGAAELTITASGGVSINYQWYSNTENNNSSGTAIAGATGNTYSAPANIPGTTYYYCVVTNTDNDATGNKTATVSSNTARVVVNTWQPPVIYTNAEAPVINVQPEDKTVNAGDSAELSLSASGVILSYQWYSNNENRNSGGTPIGGADGASYPAPTGTGGTTYYYCIVTNTDYSKTGSQTATNTSNVVRVTVNALTYAEAPVIITQPEGKAVNAGENAELLLSAGGVELSYQWYSSNENSNDGGTPISGATGAIYAASTAIPGTTYYYCIVTNTDNSKTGSQTATNTSNVVGVTIYALTHAEAPVIITQPEDKNVYLGEITDLSLSARGVELSYQWYSNNENSNSRGVPISGAADAIYAASTAIPGTTYYYCIITNTDSSKTGNQTAATTSNVVKVTVILKDAEKPVITIQPEDKTVNIGENTDLSLTASGKELSYQWYSHTENHNNGGTAIAGADGNTYTILTTATGTTYYYCVVTNTDNSKIGVKTAAITSKVVQVTVKALAPGAPANITAVSRNRQAMVSFSPPADNGGSPITGYIVTSHPGDITAIGTGTSIMVTGLTNGIIYTFTVQAVNEVGMSRESTASNAVTPHLGSDESNPGGGGSSLTITPAVPAAIKDPEENPFKVLVNGQLITAAVVNTATVDNQTVAVMVLEDEKIGEIIDQQDNNAVVTLSINSGTDIEIFQLNGQTIK